MIVFNILLVSLKKKHNSQDLSGFIDYCGDETVYLGVRLSKQLSSLKDWEKMVLKMKKVGTAIKKKSSNFHLRVRMVNTYLTLCIGYLVRFKLILKSITFLMWKSIHSALGAYANTKTSTLTSCYPSLNSKFQLHHSIIFNWTLLTSCSPMRSAY